MRSDVLTGGEPEPTGGKVRCSTRRRLVAVFSVVLAAFLAALVGQVVLLSRMEATFETMEAYESQMRLALQLEDAVRAQYGAAARVAVGQGVERAAHGAASARTLELSRALAASLGAPETAEELARIGAAATELERVLEDVAPAVARGDAEAALTHDRSYPLVAVIEQAVDRIFARLQRETSRCRQQLVTLERAAWRWTALLLLAAPLFVAAATVYLSRSVARPLARLSEGAAALAAGKLDTRIDVATRDEFGALAAEFNAMTVALRQHQQRLVESEKLAGIGRLAGGLAHELNNPLQVMLGYLSLNRDQPDRRLAEQLLAVEEEVLRCKEIIGDLRELARPPVSPAPVDLRDVCEDVAGRLRVVQAWPPHLSVAGRASALADRPRVRQVVFNLMKNAVEAAGPEGEVQVRLGAHGQSVELSVSDSGPGVPAEVRSRLFEPFFTTKEAGSGLGLAVSRAIALAHGGDIQVRNGAAGGAVFTLLLPRAPAGSAHA